MVNNDQNQQEQMLPNLKKSFPVLSDLRATGLTCLFPYLARNKQHYFTQYIIALREIFSKESLLQRLHFS